MSEVPSIRKQCTSYQRQFAIAKLKRLIYGAQKCVQGRFYMEELPLSTRSCYFFQTSPIWEHFMLILAYTFIFLAYIVDYWNKQTVHLLQIIIILMLWVDLLAETHHKYADTGRRTVHFQLDYFLKVFLIYGATLDKFVFEMVLMMELKPLLVFRCLIILFYDQAAQKAFISLISCYKDIFVYVFCESMILILFSIVVNQIAVIEPGQDYDQLSENYLSLKKTISIMYILSTYDAYPDNQTILIKNTPWIYCIFIIFIFLNFFFFVSIPTSILFNSFSETHKKQIQIKELNRQEQMIWSYHLMLQAYQKDENNEERRLRKSSLRQFMFQVLYKKKQRFEPHVKKVINRLTNKEEIDIDQFKGFWSILEQKPSKLPPLLPDYQPWIRFQRYLKDKGVPQAVKSEKTEVLVSVFIMLSITNACFAMYTDYQIFQTLDNVFTCIFLIEVITKIIGCGLQNFFVDPRNKLDIVLIVIGLILNVLPYDEIPHNADIMLKLFRVFRIWTRIGKIIKKVGKVKKIKESDVFYKYKRMTSQMGITITIVFRFLPLFLICFYFLGVIGLQIFHILPQNLAADQSPYSDYAEYSNFRTLVGATLALIQVLYEAGWSNIAFDHIYRYGHYELVMGYFILSHIVLVVILSELMKGISWALYEAINSEYHNRRMQKISRTEKSKKNSQISNPQNSGVPFIGQLASKQCLVSLNYRKNIKEKQIQLQRQEQIQDKILDNYLDNFTPLKTLQKSITKPQETQQTIEDIEEPEENQFHIESEIIMKNAFLEEADNKLTKLLTNKYFSDVYGHDYSSFKSSNPIPMMKSQSQALYYLRFTLLRPSTPEIMIGRILQIENFIVSEVLPPNSIFKIVFEIENKNGNVEWETIGRDRGLVCLGNHWIESGDMRENVCYKISDIFNSNEDLKDQNMELFNNFKKLTEILGKNQNFYQEADPFQHIFDCYSLYKAYPNTKINRLMIAIILPQGQRSSPISIQDPKTFNYQDIGSSLIKKMSILEQSPEPFTYLSHKIKDHQIQNLISELIEIISQYGGPFLQNIKNTIVSNEVQSVNESVSELYSIE